ncbi:MAG: hypothetical protein OEM62_02235 [Acidobacteriota bacterium]|nr:hypothetical protein [Acidobacteriota bacterium]
MSRRRGRKVPIEAAEDGGAMREARLALRALAGVALLLLPTLLVGSEWREGALPGGDVRSLAIHPSDPDHVLAGTASGQVFRSRDGGESWAVAGSGLPFPGWVVSDLLVDIEDPGRVWAALRGVWGQEGFVAFSGDGGRTWSSRSEGLPRHQVYALASAPGSLYAATRRGVWGSRDGGESWTHLTAANPKIQKVTSLLVDPRNPQRLFAGTWRRAYRSDDGGATWYGVFDGMVLDSEVFSLHATPGETGEIWASTCGWVYRSRHLGDTWTRFQNGLKERRTPSFQALPSGAKLAGTVRGVYRSEDDGLSWQRVTPANLTALAIAHHAARPDRVFLGTEGAGVWRSLDGGLTFQPVNRGIHAVRIASLTAQGNEVIAAVRHSGPASGIYSSFDDGASYPLGPVRLPTVVGLASDGETVFAATEKGLYYRREDSWQQVEELGQRPVRQVVATNTRVLARNEDGVFLRPRPGDRFSKIAFDRGPVASAAVHEDVIWISSATEGLFRVGDDGSTRAATPIEKGKVYAVAGKLLMAGGGELWMRGGIDTPWQQLGNRLRFHSTGNAEYPLVVVESDGRARLLGADGRAPRDLALSVPARDLSAALIRGNRILLGTSGHGVLLTDMEPLTAAVPVGGGAQTSR